MTKEQCAECNGKMQGKNVYYKLKEKSAVRVCKDCFESYLEKLGIEKERWSKIKRESRKELPTQDQLEQ